MKAIPFEKIDKYPTDVLYRMINCPSYFDTLDIDTQCYINDTLIERYESLMYGV